MVEYVIGKAKDELRENLELQQRIQQLGGNLNFDQLFEMFNDYMKSKALEHKYDSREGENTGFKVWQHDIKSKLRQTYGYDEDTSRKIIEIFNMFSIKIQDVSKNIFNTNDKRVDENGKKMIRSCRVYRMRTFSNELTIEHKFHTV